MLRVYFLPVIVSGGVQSVTDIQLIHDAILYCTDCPDAMRLLMDTTAVEHDAFLIVAKSWREPTPAETNAYNNTEFPPVPEGFKPLNPIQGVEPRLTHVEAWLIKQYPSPD